MDNISEPLTRRKYERITRLLIEKKLTVTTMESCTSGQVASLLTDTEGASAVLKGAFVTYSNEGKIREGVPAETIERYGVYSTETAIAMARACRAAYRADIGIGITGSFANADPNNPDSVPGEVFFAFDTAQGSKDYHCSVPAQPDRFTYKLYMADMIADRLLALIG